MSTYRNLYAGLTASAIAAIVAVLVSLPLESPDDILFNAASVGLSALLVGVVSGLLWHQSVATRLWDRRYLAYSLGLLIVVLVVAGGAQTQFDDAVIFTIPLALIVVLVSVVGTPFVATSERMGIWAQGFLVVVAVALSLALAGQGDQESGPLSLPPPP